MPLRLDFTRSKGRRANAAWTAGCVGLLGIQGSSQLGLRIDRKVTLQNSNETFRLQSQGKPQNSFTLIHPIPPFLFPPLQPRVLPRSRKRSIPTPSRQHDTSFKRRLKHPHGRYIPLSPKEESITCISTRRNDGCRASLGRSTCLCAFDDLRSMASRVEGGFLSDAVTSLVYVWIVWLVAATSAEVPRRLFVWD